MKRILAVLALSLLAAQVQAAGTMQFITRTTVSAVSYTAAAFSPSATAQAVLGQKWLGSFTVLHSAVNSAAYTYDFGNTAAWNGATAPGHPSPLVPTGMDRIGGGTSMYFQGGAGTVSIRVTVFGE